MNSILKLKIQLSICVFFSAITLISCKPLLQAISSNNSTIETYAASANTQDPNSAIVEAQTTPTDRPPLTITPEETKVTSQTQATTSTEPVIRQSIVVSDMPFNLGGGSGTMLALPGQVWTGTTFSGLQQWDPQTGALLQTVSDIEAEIFFDIEIENGKLWVLASINDPNQAEILYVIELPEGKIIETLPIADEGDYGTAPTQLGKSPGKIWVNFGYVDSKTLEYISLPNGLPSETHFVYDGEKWMWITGSWCEGCRHDLWLVNANDASDHEDDQNSGALDTGVLGNPLVLADGKVWLVAHYFADNNGYYLDGYDIHQTDLPVFHTDVTNEVQEHGKINITADEHMVWIELEGTLYYFDSKTGQKIGGLKVGEYVECIGFDGTSLWVLSSDAGLLQISLPWIP